jgi:hypothetical protein
VNGPEVETQYSGIPFWEVQLKRGLRITAIGGSDNHQADLPMEDPRHVGRPTTVVFANRLSERDSLDGVHAGHVYLKVTGTTSPDVRFSASSGAEKAIMGDNLRVPQGQPVSFELNVSRGAGAKVEVVQDGKVVKLITEETIGSANDKRDFQFVSDGSAHWIRINVRASDGKLLTMTNPIYLNF